MHCAQVARENLISLGVCIGKFTHSNKFILTIGALDILAQHAKFKVRGDGALARQLCTARRRAPAAARDALRARRCQTYFSLQTEALAPLRTTL